MFWIKITDPIFYSKKRNTYWCQQNFNYGINIYRYWNKIGRYILDCFQKDVLSTLTDRSLSAELIQLHIRSALNKNMLQECFVCVNVIEPLLNKRLVPL